MYVYTLRIITLAALSTSDAITSHFTDFRAPSANSTKEDGVTEGGEEITEVGDYSDDKENEVAEEDFKEDETAEDFKEEGDSSEESEESGALSSPNTTSRDASSSGKAKNGASARNRRSGKKRKNPHIDMVLSIPPKTFVPRQHPFELVLFTTAESAKAPPFPPSHP